MFSERPFFAILPKPLELDDEISIKGRTKDDAKDFSINFTIDESVIPTTIAYHFNVRFDDGLIVGNSKSQCEWQNEEVIVNEYIEGPGEEFSLIFTFKELEIVVYGEEDNTRNFICKFEHRFPFEDIRTFQVWGDILKIKELTFRYNGTNAVY